MDISRYRDLHFASDIRENVATFTHANAAKGADRGPVCFIVRGFEDEIHVFRRTYARDFLRHASDKFLRLDHTRTENEHGAFTADRYLPNMQWFCLDHESLKEAGIEQF